MKLRSRLHMLPLPFLLGVLLVDYLVVTRSSEAERNRAFGKFTAKQILDRTEPLCALIAPESGIVDLTVSQSEHKKRAFWMVEGKDKSGSYVAGFTWDAQTGELFRVGHYILEPTAGQWTIVSRGEAVKQARKWMTDLGLFEQGSKWRATPAPEIEKGRWRVHWRSADHAAFVQLGYSGGEIQMAEKWRLK